MKDLTPSSSSVFTRENCLSHSEGLLVGNTDNIFYNYKTNKKSLVEYKSGSSPHHLVKFGQFCMYKMLDDALKRTYNNDYHGCFVVWSNTYQLHESTQFKINGHGVTKNQLIDFMNLKIKFNPIDFNMSKRSYNNWNDFELYKTAYNINLNTIKISDYCTSHI